MASLEIPLSPDLAAYEFQIELDGRIYGMALTFNARMARWTLDLTDETGSPILTGVKCVTGWPILRQYVDERLPPGQLVLIDTAGQNKNAEFGELGARVALLYQEAG